jgi:hypothetical protein
MYYAGIDYHKRYWIVRIQNEQGQIVQEQRVSRGQTYTCYGVLRGFGCAICLWLTARVKNILRTIMSCLRSGTISSNMRMLNRKVESPRREDYISDRQMGRCKPRYP